MDFNSIGNNIKKYRLARGLRQEDLAKEVGLSANYIGLIERGQKVPSLETFILILNALEASADIVLADVLESGYLTKSSLLGEKLKDLSPEDREHIFDIVDTFIKKS